LLGTPLLFIGGWLNSYGVRNGNFAAMVIGWSMTAAGAFCVLAFLVPLAAQSF